MVPAPAPARPARVLFRVRTPSHITPRLPLLALGLSFAARAVLALGTDAYADEAYYWAWSRHLDWSYFDHPPLVAWLIAAFSIRPGAYLTSALATAGVYLAAREHSGSKETALWAAAFWTATPAATLLGTFATPDAPLLAAWAFALWGLAARRPVVTGVAWGLSMLGKYNGLLLLVPVVAAFWRRPRALLTAGVIAGALASPILYWNAVHDWEGFRFQLNHGLGRSSGGLRNLAEFVVGQLGIGSPLLVLLSLWWVARRPLEHDAWLKLALLTPLLLFGYASVRTRGEANWAAAAWVAASIGVAGAVVERRSLRGVTLAVALVPTVLLCLGLAFPPRAALEAVPLRRLHGWRALASLGGERLPVFSTSYQLSSLATLYAGVDASTVGGRRSQFDLWPALSIPVGGSALWLCDPPPPTFVPEPPPEYLARRFSRVVPLAGPANDFHHFCLFRLEGRLPDSPPPVTSWDGQGGP